MNANPIEPAVDGYGSHVTRLRDIYARALGALNEAAPGADSVLLHSGGDSLYFADDTHVPFQSYGHFLHWLPVARPDQFLWIRPGERPVYFQVIPDDFWYEQAIDNQSWWAGEYDLRPVTDVAAVVNDSDLARHSGRMAYLGPNGETAGLFAIAEELRNPARLVHFLDYHRAVKSGYEIAQHRAANVMGLVGHEAARNCFLNGGNEYAVHQAFLQACGILESEAPYVNIVAQDEKSAILHYQNKRRRTAQDAKVLLIDAGCRVNNYCSDITRMTVKDSAPPIFQSLVAALDRLQQALVAHVKPRLEYRDLHGRTMDGIADLLLEHGIATAGKDELIEKEIPRKFMPHGTGHLLGVQVHDVGGHQKDERGTMDAAADDDTPPLRNTRVMAEDMVFTIEPGCYFIPMLLEPKREEWKSTLNWRLIDELYSCGGIRIEDNVRVTASGVENLTRVQPESLS